MKRMRSWKGTVEGFNNSRYALVIGPGVPLGLEGKQVTLTWEVDVPPHRCEKMREGWEFQWGKGGEQVLWASGALFGAYLPLCPFCGEQVNPEEGSDG